MGSLLLRKTRDEIKFSFGSNNGNFYINGIVYGGESLGKDEVKYEYVVDCWRQKC